MGPAPADKGNQNFLCLCQDCSLAEAGSVVFQAGPSAWLSFGMGTLREISRLRNGKPQSQLMGQRGHTLLQHPLPEQLSVCAQCSLLSYVVLSSVLLSHTCLLTLICLRRRTRQQVCFQSSHTHTSSSWWFAHGPRVTHGHALPPSLFHPFNPPQWMI